ncbi:MAG TPA: FtsW/RodA/SpoVE family cell cycle protein [Thermoflexia bacterium]|nr:FtsW/RodA/SpoVE family cell cycle protein [Thermoflexia bacterium]
MGEKGRRRKRRRRPDYVLIGAVAALMVLGLMMVYSTTVDSCYVHTEDHDPFCYLRRQLLWTLLGVGVAVVLARMDYRRLRQFAVPILVVTLVLLALVLLVGYGKEGERRSLFGPSVRPAELAKLTAAIYIAVWASSKGEQIRDVTYGMIPFIVLIGLLAGLVMFQTDRSAAVVIAFVSIGTFFVAGADLLQVLLLGTVLGAVFAVVSLAQGYSRQRIDDYLILLQGGQPANDHVVNALRALGGGGVWGLGLGMGHQKFGYLYVPHTDSIFAVIGEELGFVGCLLVLGLFAVVAWRGFRIALEARDMLGTVLASGLTLFLVSHVLINVGGITGMIPFTGITLPFFSVGGSSLTVSLAAVGILVSISRGGGGNYGRKRLAVLDSGGRDGGTRLSRIGRSARA